MSLSYDELHEGLVYLNSTDAFEEFITLYKFRGGEYVFKSLFELQNYYYSMNGKEHPSHSLLACCDGRGYRVNNEEYFKIYS